MQNYRHDQRPEEVRLSNRTSSVIVQTQPNQPKHPMGAELELPACHQVKGIGLEVVAIGVVVAHRQ
jgi:hypothetical protein